MRTMILLIGLYTCPDWLGGLIFIWYLCACAKWWYGISQNGWVLKLE